MEEKIKNMNPLAVLKRGYSITWKMPEQRVLKDASGVEAGDRVRVTLSEGGLECRVEKIT
jgi:exodeoxyribonuclease VII large subunit